MRAWERSLKGQVESRKGKTKTRIEMKTIREEKKMIDREATGAAATNESWGVILTF